MSYERVRIFDFGIYQIREIEGKKGKFYIYKDDVPFSTLIFNTPQSAAEKLVKHYPELKETKIISHKENENENGEVLCACGCGNTFILMGDRRQKYIPLHAKHFNRSKKKRERWLNISPNNIV